MDIEESGKFGFDIDKVYRYGIEISVAELVIIFKLLKKSFEMGKRIRGNIHSKY